MKSAQPRDSVPGRASAKGVSSDSAPTMPLPTGSTLGDRQAVTATATVVDFIRQKNSWAEVRGSRRQMAGSAHDFAILSMELGK